MVNMYNILDVKELIKGYTNVVVSSGGVDPLHFGHVRCILESAEKYKGPDGVFVFIVNSDEWLMRKKGFVFMPLEERMEIVQAIKGVDYVVSWDDGTPYVTGALEILRPNIFTKGGDRSDPDKVPEFSLCKKIGCEVIFGVGGRDKVQSSSELVKNMKAKG